MREHDKTHGFGQGHGVPHTHKLTVTIWHRARLRGLKRSGTDARCGKQLIRGEEHTRRLPLAPCTLIYNPVRDHCTRYYLRSHAPAHKRRARTPMCCEAQLLQLALLPTPMCTRRLSSFTYTRSKGNKRHAQASSTTCRGRPRVCLPKTAPTRRRA